MQRRALVISLALAAASATGFAQTYPERPVKLVVPYAPGGSADIVARLIADEWGKALGKSVFIENKAGAGGNLGVDAVAKSPADGYTVGLQTVSLAINPSLTAKMPYDTLKDLAPIGMVAASQHVLVVNNNLPAKDLKELLALAKSKPGKLTYGSAGGGSTFHMSAELFKAMAGLAIVHIPYRGGGAAVADLISGQVQMMIDVMPNVYPLAKDGRIRGIAVSTAVRFPGAPELPTIAESGVAGFEASAWDGILAPARTPEAIVNKLNAAIRAALADPELIELLKSRGARVVPGTPDDFAHHIVASTKKWAEVVKASGAKID